MIICRLPPCLESHSQHLLDPVAFRLSQFKPQFQNHNPEPNSWTAINPGSILRHPPPAVVTGGGSEYQHRTDRATRGFSWHSKRAKLLWEMTVYGQKHDTVSIHNWQSLTISFKKPLNTFGNKNYFSYLSDKDLFELQLVTFQRIQWNESAYVGDRNWNLSNCSR